MLLRSGYHTGQKAESRLSNTHVPNIRTNISRLNNISGLRLASTLSGVGIGHEPNRSKIQLHPNTRPPRGNSRPIKPPIQVSVRFSQGIYSNNTEWLAPKALHIPISERHCSIRLEITPLRLTAGTNRKASNNQPCTLNTFA